MSKALPSYTIIVFFTKFTFFFHVCLCGPLHHWCVLQGAHIFILPICLCVHMCIWFLGPQILFPFFVSFVQGVGVHDVGITPSMCSSLSLPSNESSSTPCDTPPHSLKDSNVNLKMKTMKKGIGACSLTPNTLGVEGHVGALGWGVRRVTNRSIIHIELHKPNNKLISVGLGHFWCTDELLAYTYSQDSPQL